MRFGDYLYKNIIYNPVPNSNFITSGIQSTTRILEPA